MTDAVEPFALDVPDAELARLRRRLRDTRWPTPAGGPPWGLGTDDTVLRALVARWADDFDWRAVERRLNRYPHRRTRIGGLTVHFVHARGVGPGPARPLLLTHGWPSSFVELLPVVDRLTDPARYGLPGPAFDVVVPSLPGYCFSDPPPHGHTFEDTAALWHALMLRLGHPRYGVHGGDIGSAVSTLLARDHPEAVAGVHLNDLELAPDLGPGSPAPSAAERAYVEHERRWGETEGGYHAVQSTRPQSLAFGLADSPAGLAAWLLDKWRAWSDCDGDPVGRLSAEFVLTTLTLYWVTGTIASSLRDFAANGHVYDLFGPHDRVEVPTAITLFDREFVDAGTVPREWAQRLHHVVRWTVHPRGGHFPGIEQPDLLARGISSFFATDGGARWGPT